MITPEFAQLMARYNHWQNESLMAAADQLSEAQRHEDRGAFFGSIAATFAHVLWADQLWLSRFGACAPPAAASIPESTAPMLWPSFCNERRDTDTVLHRWADTLTAEELEGKLSWYSGALGREVTKPRDRLVAHMFNHQTHHRGQIHCMLTIAGQRPEDTDIPFMPDRFEELTL